MGLLEWWQLRRAKRAHGMNPKARASAKLAMSRYERRLLAEYNEATGANKTLEERFAGLKPPSGAHKRLLFSDGSGLVLGPDDLCCQNPDHQTHG